MERRWRRCNKREIGTGPWRGPAGAVTFHDGVYHAEAWLAGEANGRFMKHKTFATEAAAKRAVERWLDQHAARPKRKRGGR